MRSQLTFSSRTRNDVKRVPMEPIERGGKAQVAC